MERTVDRMSSSTVRCTNSLRGIFAPEFLDHGLRSEDGRPNQSGHSAYRQSFWIHTALDHAHACGEGLSVQLSVEKLGDVIQGWWEMK